jgi:hypothetical protein
VASLFGLHFDTSEFGPPSQNRSLPAATVIVPLDLGFNRVEHCPIWALVSVLILRLFLCRAIICKYAQRDGCPCSDDISQGLFLQFIIDAFYGANCTATNLSERSRSGTREPLLHFSGERYFRVFPR